MSDNSPSRNDTTCSESVRDRRAALVRKWRRAVAAYEAAGAPFGPSTRAVEVWIEYGRQTRTN